MRRSAELATLGLLMESGADRRLLAQFLAETGHAVVIAGKDRDEGLASADLVIVDEALACRDRAFLDEVRSRAWPLHLPVLLLASSATEERAWIGGGWDDVLQLPVEKDHLLARIETFVRIRRASERAESESEERFRMTVDRAPVGMAHCTLDGRFIRVNRSLCQILARDERELRRMRLPDLIAGADAPGVPPAPGASPWRPGSVEHEVRHARHDGKEIWLRVSTWPANGGAHEPAYLVAIIEDVTVRREAEARLAAANAELESRVAQRTAELRMANEELHAFTASVSHDLRGPVRAIEGLSTLLLETGAANLEGRAGHLVLRLSAAAGRMGAMIEGLLELSRASRIALQDVPVDLSAIARDVLEDLAASAPQREVDTEVEDGLACRGDPVLLRIVMDNLLGNAWKYTCLRPRARIEVGRVPGGSGDEFFVRDNGAGFDPAYAERLFQPFERLHSESEFPGAGMGLATVMRIVKRHGGTMRAESAPGHGATFSFRLPAK